MGLETTLKRPIINTRDEPHADADKYRRLHVIIGDANLSEISTFLKVGTTALILTMIEEKALGADLGIADPVGELRAVSHDPSLKHLMRMRDGRKLTALDVQWAYLERVSSFVDDRYGKDVDAQTADVLRRWESVLDRLGRDAFECADELDWVAKLRLLEGYREREKLGWGSHKLQLVDLQYSDVRPEKGLYHRLVQRGSMKTLLSDEQTRTAMTEPPEDTRAYFRGRCLAQYASEVVAASWDSVIFDVGRESLVRVPMMEPERGTRAHVGELFDRCESAKDLLETLTGGLTRMPEGPSGAGTGRAAGLSSLPRGKLIAGDRGGGTTMATQEGGQTQSGKSREEVDEVTAEANPEVAERHAEITEDVDDLLDEIDSVLEENAEEFVRGYVQKGGQ